jgi:IclR family acetate operon transcriptional repressor
MSKLDSSPSVKSATRTLDILEFVVEWGRPVPAMDIANALSIPISSLSYLLSTLVERDYLARDGRLYLPGRALDRLRSSQGNKRSLIERIEPLVRTLTSQLDETAAFFVRDGFAAEALCSATSQQALRYAIDAGQKVPMHAFAGGKALLAGMSVEELDAFFAHAALETFRPNTITDEAHLRAQIAEIRNGGLAVTREEYTPGIHGFAVPVIEETRTIGAISVAVPAVRATEALELRIAALLQRTADLIAAQ